MSQNWIGGSALPWVQQHVVQHHLHTNDVNLDPDMAGQLFLLYTFIDILIVFPGSSYIRLNPLKPLMGYHIVQHIYFFGLLAVYGFSVVIQSFRE